MKRRIRSIFWLMVVCMVGINGFQAYWLYTNYQVTAMRYERTVREALLSVVQRYQLDLAREFVNKTPGKKGKLVVFQDFEQDGQRLNQVVVRSRADSGLVDSPQPRIVRVEVDKNIFGPLRRNIRPGEKDTLVHKLSKILISNWTGASAMNMPQLAADYHAELRQRGADAPLLLDTITVASASHNMAASPVVFNQAPRKPGFTLQTPPVSLNPFRNLYVRASFEPPTFYVLRQMSGLLAGSVLLLALTTGCFLLMLDTILKQRRLSEVKNDFINNMTHELKTPLATVSAAVEALQDFGALNDPRKTDTYLTIARQELRRLSDLVEKVLNIAVEERHDRALQLCTENVRPAELVAELVSRHQLQAPKPVHFEVDIPATDTVRLDPLHVSGVINNLIDNAIKYSREQVTIAIRGRHEADGWLLSVSDDGLGIPRSYQEAIFDQFFRVPTGNLHPVKGFGLGLYYVRQVMERHGGRVSVRSEPNRGSAFSLWLPN
jgi:two-component system phosphate regulon sensor histidine kinase PhoR